MMCLKSIIKSYKRKKSGVGWKIFVYDESGRKIETVHQGNSKSIPINKFVHEGEYRSCFSRSGGITFYGNRDLLYPYGFHIFINKKDAIREGSSVRNVRKVKYRGGHTKGIDVTYNSLTIVAEEICVGRSV